MAYSIAQDVGDGSTTLFNVTFPFISRDHVTVQVAGVPTSFTWMSDAQIQITPAPAEGAVIDIRRSSNRTSRIVNYQDASVLTEALMDQDANQAFFIAQEAFDEAEQSAKIGADGTISAGNKRVTNVAEPSLDTDAATKGYVNDFMESSVDAAAGSAAAAAVSASQADAARVLSESARDASDASADAAAASAIAADAARIAAEEAADQAAAGGVQSVTAGNTTVTVGGTTANPTVAVNLGSKNAWNAQQSPKWGALTDAATIAWDADASGQVASVTLGGHRTIALPTNLVAFTPYILVVNVNGFTPSWASGYRWAGGVAPSGLVGDCVFTFLSNASGTALRCTGYQIDVR